MLPFHQRKIDLCKSPPGFVPSKMRRMRSLALFVSPAVNMFDRPNQAPPTRTTRTPVQIRPRFIVLSPRTPPGSRRPPAEARHSIPYAGSMVLACALLVLVAATVGLGLDFEPALSWYFQIAWWSYVVAVDDVNRRLAGRSLLRDRPLRFLWLSLASVLWWTLFEAVNLRLGNWYYVMDHPER